MRGLEPMDRRKPSFLSLTDLFCGAGGASIGAAAAGCQLVMGINHWPIAIETHQLNFPHADHDCRDISETHPSRYRSTHLLWASPECPTWSQARGKRRNFHGQLGLTEDDEPLPTAAEERSRVTMWDVVRYAEYHTYEAVVVENVVDVMPWSLLACWYQAMETLGYEHRTLFLNSMIAEHAGDGAPQSRDRWYAVFWRRGNRRPDLELTPPAWCPRCEAVVEGRQSFKKPKRWTDRYGTQYLYLCPRCAGTALPLVVPALAAIDLSVRGERIGDKKKPLAQATMARIEAGIRRYWTPSGPTGRRGQVLYLPLVARFRGTEPSHIDGSGRPATEPFGTISAGGIHHGVVGPPLYVKNQGGVAKAAPMAHPVTDPLGTLTAAGNTALVMPMGRGASRTVNDPLRAQTSIETDGLPPPPMVVQAAGHTFERKPGSCRIGPADQRPLWTQPATAQTGVVAPPLIYVGRARNRSRPASEPLPTFSTGGNMGLVAPTNGNRHGYGGERVRSVGEPLSTQTADLYRALITSYYGREDASRPIDEPMGTVTGDPRHAFLSAYYGTAVNRDVAEPMPTCTTVDRHALVEGPALAVEECLFSVVLPREIGLGMAFPGSYRVEAPKQKWVVRMYGLAVTPPVATWIWQRVIESLR